MHARSFAASSNYCVVVSVSRAVQLNVYKPLIIRNMLHSTRLLADACASRSPTIALWASRPMRNVSQLLHDSLMLVTALTRALDTTVRSCGFVVNFAVCCVACSRVTCIL